jgi:hypothetical protein
MQRLTIFRLEWMLKLHDTDFSTTADLNLILNRAEIARTTFYGRSSAYIGHALIWCNGYANTLAVPRYVGADVDRDRNGSRSSRGSAQRSFGTSGVQPGRPGS